MEIRSGHRSGGTVRQRTQKNMRSLTPFSNIRLSCQTLSFQRRRGRPTGLENMCELLGSCINNGSHSAATRVKLWTGIC